MSLSEQAISLLRDAFEDAPFEFWARDLAGRCVVSNAAARAIGSLLGTTVDEAQVSDEVKAAWHANNARAYRGECVQNEVEYGDARHLQCYVVPLRIHGDILGILGFNIDLTEHKQTERRLGEALRVGRMGWLELLEVDRRRGEFLGVLSHELRNPLAAIAASAKYLDRAAIADEQARRAIATIERQARHLARLVDDLLDVTRVRSGKIHLQRELVDVVELVRATVEDHRAALAGRELSVVVPPTPARVHGDPTRLAQVLGNVLDNAAKFTPAGGAIAVSLAIADDRAVLRVADTGIGIDEESLGRLFVPFVQVDRRVEGNRAGLGIGLALVRTLVEMHGGEVNAHSDGLGRGTVLTIALPLAADEPAIATRVETTNGHTGPRRNVLIIEDDADVAEWLAHALTFAGHRVTITLDGEAGITKARELAPDVVLCDLGLPGKVDGYAVARALQHDAMLTNTYRVALSGYAQPEDQIRAREAGFEAHVTKPPDMQTLERLIAEMPR